MPDSSPAARLCEWCRGSIPARARRDSKYCGTPCRQAAHRFKSGAPRRSSTASPMRLAYADPPYPAKDHYYAGRLDAAGAVDQRALVAHLVEHYPDGWALSTSAAALQELLAACPPGVRVAAWVRGERPARAWEPLSSWEPVIVCGGRPQLRSARDDRRVDSLVYAARPRLTDVDRVVGAKPAAFCYWLFELLGALPGDDLVDLFPGSGGVARAWRYVCDAAEPSDPPASTTADPLGDLDTTDPSCFTTVAAGG